MTVPFSLFDDVAALGDVFRGLARTAGRPLPPEPEPPVLDVWQFADARAIMSAAGFRYFISCYLLDAEFQLEEITRARVARNFSRVAHKARILDSMATHIGARRTAQAARRLDQACRAGRHRDTYPLISRLGQCCAEADSELRAVLALQDLEHQPEFRA